MRQFVVSLSTRRTLWWSLAVLLIARLLCSAVVPLTDTTEARYGEIARKMLETGDWITPQHDYGVPFWAKPPLSTWLASGSMKLFGINEFAVRLPSTLLGIGMLLLVGWWARARHGRDFALAATTALAGMSLFFTASGAVMTDASLAFCTTLAMVAFWQALRADSARPHKYRSWGYVFFIALGLGLLAKGPLVGVLTLLPISLWIALNGNWRDAWRALPWLRGTLLMLAIAAPWYVAAEHKTPGFLTYFIFGEHLGRFLHAGWTGDKYGNAHAEPLGMVWLFWLAAALPWSFVFVARIRTLFQPEHNAGDGWLSYLLLWSFIPVLFFSFAHNIIWTYPLPALPAFAVLTQELLMRRASEKPFGPQLAALNMLTPAAMLVVTALYGSGMEAMLKPSQKSSASYFLQQHREPDAELYYFHHRYYSGEFYTGGKARTIDEKHLSDLFDNGHTDYLMIRDRDLDHLAPALRAHFRAAKTFGNLIMLREVDKGGNTSLATS